MYVHFCNKNSGEDEQPVELNEQGRRLAQFP